MSIYDITIGLFLTIRIPFWWLVLVFVVLPLVFLLYVLNFILYAGVFNGILENTNKASKFFKNLETIARLLILPILVGILDVLFNFRFDVLIATSIILATLRVIMLVYGLIKCTVSDDVLGNDVKSVGIYTMIAKCIRLKRMWLFFGFFLPIGAFLYFKIGQQQIIDIEYAILLECRGG